MQHPEIVKISENEYFFGTDKVTHIGNSILVVETQGDQTPELVDLIKNNYHEFFNLFGGKVKLLVDLDHIGKNPPVARRLWTEVARDPLTTKLAVYGMHPVARVLASFIMGTTHISKYRFFESKEEALNWLKQ